VERGTVIASATSNVSGGTTLLKMADLNQVQVRTLVDETDIGKLQPGQRATITVDAYPQRPFSGTVLKIEPQAQTEQNVTMFPVLVRIANQEGLLRPGMNTEVEIHVGEREDVLAVPNAALRTQRDVGSAAQVLGLLPEAVQKQLADTRPATRGDSTGRADSAGHSSMGATAPSTNTAAGSQRSGSGRRRRQAQAAGAQYIVFVERNGQPTPVWIRTGLTDMDYSEVLQGLTEADSVLLLPSASLVQSQQDMRERVNRFTGGGAVPGMRQQTSAPSQGARP
jgi:HlyD family secretion protein